MQEATAANTEMTDEELKARAKLWCAQKLRDLDAYEATLCAPADIEDEDARKEAEYDAWVRQKVREAWESATFWTQEEMEAEDEAWWAEVQGRAANEADLGRGGEG